MFFLAFARLHPILSWDGLSEQVIGVIAGTDTSNRRDAAELALRLESVPAKGGTLDTTLLLNVQSALLADESGSRTDAETEAQSSSW
ncbi:hypothetical protein [Haloterrigena salifodinae]|uniref:hypothetical protein n=1 Tax=Haloterrigena salifodinae TaxID=2675099 RepID=UPI000F89D47A|nr:hypothetical protein [Haloterrigena salifodinae]